MFKTPLFSSVRTYTYLGVVFHDDLNWRHYIDHVLARGERRMAACLSWTASHTDHLPLHVLEGLFRAYVQPSVCFGLELVPDFSHLQRANARMFQSGRRLLLWPRGAPTAATRGQLGWRDLSSSRLLQAAGLLARLFSLPCTCLAGRIARDACAEQTSWANAVLLELARLGVAPPSNWGITAGTPQTVVKAWLRHVRDAVSRHSKLFYSNLLRCTEIPWSAMLAGRHDRIWVAYRYACPMAARS